GKVMRARAEGREIPEEWGFLDIEGLPTTDPETALSGIIPALGAVAAYKGSGLSLFMNLLAGALPGGYHSKDVNIGKRGQFLLVIDPEIFGDADEFAEKVDSMVEQIKSADPLPGVNEVFAPGEIEQRAHDERIAAGHVVYPASTLQELRELSSEMGIPLGA
ncbi:MAG: Ldh family oxidoreductase, partial [Gemmatimonadetes bacterium]|nr:Ldh family oxidoreductase [Gemmatimonadota bacterium]